MPQPGILGTHARIQPILELQFRHMPEVRKICCDQDGVIRQRDRSDPQVQCADADSFRAKPFEMPSGHLVKT